MNMLRAVYVSPSASGSKTFSSTRLPELPEGLASPASRACPSTASRTAHLNALQNAITVVQDDVNAWLTSQMAEDKAREEARSPAGAGSGAARLARTGDEDAEECNYGEERQN